MSCRDEFFNKSIDDIVLRMAWASAFQDSVEKCDEVTSIDSVEAVRVSDGEIFHCELVNPSLDEEDIGLYIKGVVGNSADEIGSMISVCFYKHGYHFVHDEDGRLMLRGNIGWAYEMMGKMQSKVADWLEKNDA